MNIIYPAAYLLRLFFNDNEHKLPSASLFKRPREETNSSRAQIPTWESVNRGADKEGHSRMLRAVLCITLTQTTSPLGSIVLPLKA